MTGQAYDPTPMDEAWSANWRAGDRGGRWTAAECASQGHTPSDHTDPTDVTTEQSCTCLPGQVCPPCRSRGYQNGLAGYAARIYPTPVCPWCANPDADDNGTDTDLLCRSHLAEYEGMSVDALDRRDAAEADELFWSHH